MLLVTWFFLQLSDNKISLRTKDDLGMIRIVDLRKRVLDAKKLLWSLKTTI